MPDEIWPKYYRAKLFCGDPQSDLALCTGWSDAELFAKKIGPAADKLALVGSLRSVDGLNYILRNWCLNPRIRKIIVAGNPGFDYSSIDFLRAFLERGVDEDGCVPGIKFETRSKIHAEIPRDLLETFRKNVTVEFWHEEKTLPDFEKLAIKINAEAGTAEPVFTGQDFPLPKVETNRNVPTPEGSHSLIAENVFDGWIKVLSETIHTGWRVHIPNRDKEYLQITNLCVTIKNPILDDAEAKKFPDGSREKIEHYVKNSILADTAPPGTSYTYGSKLHAWQGKTNQIRELATAIKEKKFERTLATLWDPSQDIRGEHQPCLFYIYPFVHQDRLMLTAGFRSHNLARAWYENAFGMAALQRELCDLIGGDISPGPLVLISHNGRLDLGFADDAAKLVAENWHNFDPDPRGSFRIEIDRDAAEIRVIHASADGETLGAYAAKTAMAMMQQIGPLVHFVGHAFDLGAELQKAEIALQTGAKFTQDRPLDFSEKSG